MSDVSPWSELVVSAPTAETHTGGHTATGVLARPLTSEHPGRSERRTTGTEHFLWRRIDLRQLSRSGPRSDTLRLCVAAIPHSEDCTSTADPPPDSKHRVREWLSDPESALHSTHSVCVPTCATAEIAGLPVSLCKPPL